MIVDCDTTVNNIIGAEKEHKNHLVALQKANRNQQCFTVVYCVSINATQHLTFNNFDNIS